MANDAHALERSFLKNNIFQHKRKIYSISELTAEIKKILEHQYPMVWVSGEISNFKISSSGHAYFTLKDRNAQIASVMFKGQRKQLKFDLEDGITLVGFGRISVYEPRGTYQIIIEYAEPKGIGALQIAFEQLKQKLDKEGLFAEAHKKIIPFLPHRLGIITSPTGAVIQDILKICQRRFPNLSVDIYPVRVQGHEAEYEIVQSILLANRLIRNDVLILARGGGALEDLAPFNSEEVARAIYHSQLPIVSAVGHETDYTIADFVSDLRAPTPSAAAEIVVPIKSELQSRCVELKLRSQRAFQATIDRYRNQLPPRNRMLIHPNKKIQDMRRHLDQLLARLGRGFYNYTQQTRARYEKANIGLSSHSPVQVLSLYRSKIILYRNTLLQLLKMLYIQKLHHYKAADGVLHAMNPTAILQRGYSITRTVPLGQIVTNSNTIVAGQLLEIQLANGQIDVVVQKKDTLGRED